MTKIKTITMGKSVYIFDQQDRYLKPNSKNCKWGSMTLPYNINPGDRVKIVSAETKLSGEFYLIQDSYLTEIGIILIRLDDNDDNYSFIAFNMGNSTVTLNSTDTIGKCVHISGLC